MPLLLESLNSKKLAKQTIILSLLICLMVSLNDPATCQNSNTNPSCTNGVIVGYYNAKLASTDCVCACNPGWEGVGCTISCPTCTKSCPDTFYHSGSSHYCTNGRSIGMLSSTGSEENCGCDCRGTGKYGFFCQYDATCKDL
jgi:hypothetical protein